MDMAERVPSQITRQVLVQLDIEAVKSMAVLDGAWADAAESILWPRVSFCARDRPDFGYCIKLLDDARDGGLEHWILERCAQLETCSQLPTRTGLSLSRTGEGVH